MTRATNQLSSERSLTPKQQKWRRLLSKLEERCLQPIDEFRKLGTVVDTKNGPLIHVDRGSKILGVAHMDTVSKTPTSVRWQVAKRRSLPIINSIQLDDRLGVWMLLDLLPAMGMTFDVLLCDSEERGASTAEHFKPTREYNWGFEFDRAGVDTVLYDYEDDETWEKALKAAGFDIQFGSFSDISSLTHVGCCFANFGCGYHNQHSQGCYACLDDTVLMAMEFETWYKDNKDKAYKFTPVERYSRWNRRFSSYSSYDSNWTKTKSGTWSYTPAKSKAFKPKPSEHGCPLCGKPISFIAGLVSDMLYECPWCNRKFEGEECLDVDQHGRIDTIPKCSWCGARAWDETGICDVCGYDPQTCKPFTEDDVVIECPICGGDMDDEYCCYCGYVEEGVT